MISNTIPLKFTLLVIGCSFYFFILNFLIEVCVLTGINRLFRLMFSLGKRDNPEAKEQLRKNI